MGLVIEVMSPIRSPMESWTKSFRSSSELSWIVDITSAFHNIYFSTCRPFTVFVVSWKQPNCWPKPITFWKFSSNLHSSVCEMESVSRSDFSTHNWINVVISVRESCAAIKVISCTLIDNTSSPQVIVISISNFISSYFILGEDWLDFQCSIWYERSGTIIVI